MRKIVLAALLAAFPLSALAQTSPGLVFGQVPTAGQWNSYFANKQDVLNYTPVNKAGDVMLGPLVTAPPTASLSGFGLPHGTAPTTPANGDMWTTTAGLFVRISGTTVGPLVGGAGGSTFTTPVTINLSGGTPSQTPPAGSLLSLISANGANNNIINLYQYGGGSANNDLIIQRQANGTAASPTATTAGNTLGAFGWSGFNGTTFYNTSFIIVASNETFVSGAAGGADMQFFTTPNATVALARSMTIKASGAVVVGTAADTGINSLSSADVYTADATFLIRTKATLTNSAAANTATLTNAPTAGNPTKWFSFDDNGTTRRIPAW